jgi:hypothetical protein
MFIHGIGVQLGLMLGLAEVTVRGFDDRGGPQMGAVHAHRD